MNSWHISHTSEAVKDGKAGILSDRKEKEGEGKTGVGRGEQGRRKINAVELLLCSMPDGRQASHRHLVCKDWDTVSGGDSPSAWPVPGYHLSPVSCYSSRRLSGMGELEPGSAGNRFPLAKTIFPEMLLAPWALGA